MPKKKSISEEEDFSGHLWRGGRKIDLEKVEDRFTITPENDEQVEKLKKVPGVQAIKPITRQVYKVETSASDRDKAMEIVRSESINAVAHHAYRPKETEGTMYYLTDRITVKFDPGATSEEIDSLAGKYHLKVVKKYEGLEHTYLFQVTSESGENPIKIANRLTGERLVKYAEPNLINRYKPAFIPLDPYFKHQWHLNSAAGPDLAGDASVQAVEAWEITRGERSIVVCIIDDGFDITHTDLQGDGKIVAPKDYVDGDSQPFPVGDNYHGTPCAGVAIAECNGEGVVGIAPGCSFMPIRFSDEADDDLLVTIYAEAARYADVISCSWGPVPCYAPLSSSVKEVITRIATTGGPRGKGCVICFAAGNESSPLNDPVNEKGVRWFDGKKIRWTIGPILYGEATHPHVIAVAASTSMNKHAAYSNWGKEVSVCAPSNNFHPLTLRPLPGLGIWTTDNESYGSGFSSDEKYTGDFGGTSSATPLVAGIAALVLSVNPNLTASEVKEILEKTADKIIDEEPDLNGDSRGNYDTNGHSEWFGYGKVNARKAVEEAKSRIDR